MVIHFQINKYTISINYTPISIIIYFYNKGEYILYATLVFKLGLDNKYHYKIPTVLTTNSQNKTLLKLLVERDFVNIDECENIILTHNLLIKLI